MPHSPDTLSAKLKAFVRMRASLIDEPVVCYWQGSVYRSVKLSEATSDYPATGGLDPSSSPILKVVGMNMGRAYYDGEIPLRDGTVGHGYYFLGKELQLYLDAKTGAVLDHWENPMIPRNVDGTGGLVTRKVQVLHTTLSPVNWVWAEPYDHSQGRGFAAFETPSFSSDKPGYEEIGGKAVYSVEFFQNEPSRLEPDDTATAKYARFSAGRTYQAAEIYNFIADAAEITDPRVVNAKELSISWTRISPYLPWMHMGRAPGGVVISAYGCKIPGAFRGLPNWLRQVVLDRFPAFAEPSQGRYPIPNFFQDSWTFFKRDLDEGRYQPTLIP